MSLPTAYLPSEFEDKTYKLWEKNQAFMPKDRGNSEPFSLVMPPPNANGNLHIGHALTSGIQDIIIRYQRMLGKEVLFLPGADHAGFETQVVYEKELAKQGKSRFDLSREELYAQIWDFVALNKGNYGSQLRRLGVSADWDSFTFTLDDKIINRANLTFKKLWDDELIYRGERLVNFCTFHGTAFADIEVEYKDEIGKMYYIKFPINPVSDINDKKDFILIATTRPETMLGDVAVAVNPSDKRYKQLIGRTVTIPLANRQVPVIADKMVDAKFGTGAVKITAAHDPNDFDVAQNHNLPLLKVITEEGKIGHDAPARYHNLDINEARKQIIDELKDQSLLEKVTDHQHRVGHCYKCGTVIQPLVREQWFISMQPLAKRAITALKNNEINFYPVPKLNQLITYLEGLRDWNVSRQIAWGIPIPAFQNINKPDDWIFNTKTDQELIELNGQTYRRDPDVFDTWFSSAQWPFATMDYPDGEDFKKFYPLSLMETGADILAPWVSRMIMLGLYVTDSIPFKTVYLHGMVMDEHGAKMSKSKGNVVNPMDVIDQYGSDALRMGAITGQTAGNNQPFTTAKIIGARNFCNKLWNIARYVESKPNSKHATPQPITTADYWVLNILQQSSKDIANLLDNYKLGEAYDKLYHTVWDDVADWYIEASKNEVGDGMLGYVLETILKLAHPFAPFVTETIWQSLNKDDLLITSRWPKIIKADKKMSSEFTEIISATTELRQLIKNIGLSKPILSSESALITRNAGLITSLAKLGGVEQGSGDANSVRLVSSQSWLQVSSDKLSAYKLELQNKISNKQTEVDKLSKRLSNKAYTQNAPKQIVEQSRGQIDELKAELKILKSEFENLQTT